MRRKAAADRAEKVSNQRPSSTRAAGAGGSSSTMLSKSTFGRLITFRSRDADRLWSKMRWI